MSGRNDHVVWELLDAVQMDLRAASAKMVQLRSHVAALNLSPPSAYLCPECLVVNDLRSAVKLAEHRYHSHDGPLPEHWAKAEALAMADDIRRPDDDRNPRCEN